MSRKLISRISVILISFVFALELNAFDYKVEGCFCEGGLIYAKVGTDSTVFIDDSPVKLSDDNYFVYAFGRKHSNSIKIKINDKERTFEIKKKKYIVERINKLPVRKVEPSETDIKKIIRERKQFANAKKKSLNIKLFTENFTIPVEGRISGRFGSQRILNNKPKRPHFGLDIAAKKGTNIYMPTDGIVKKVFDDMFFTGKTIIVDHGIGLISIFAHLSDANVKEEQILRKGEIIGKVGMTGRATGPHLHWGIYLENIPVDPEIFINVGAYK